VFIIVGQEEPDYCGLLLGSPVR